MLTGFTSDSVGSSVTISRSIARVFRLAGKFSPNEAQLKLGHYLFKGGARHK